MSTKKLKTSMKSNKHTLAADFETVAHALKSSKLTSQAFAEVADEISFIRRKMKVTPEQAFILAAMLKNADETMDTRGFAYYADVSLIRIMGMQKEFDDLVKNGLILCVKPTATAYWSQAFTLNAGVIHAVKYNKEFTHESYKDLQAQDVMEMIEKLLDDCDNGRILYHQMVDCLEKLIADAENVELCNKVKELGLNQTDLVMLLIGVVSLVCNGDSLITTLDYEDIIPRTHRRQMTLQFKSKRNSLYTNGLMEATDNDFDTFRLTSKVKKEFLYEFDFVDDAEFCSDEYEGSTATPAEKDKVPAAEKELFYNPEEKEQIDRLRILLSKETFEKVQNRMRDAGMRPGFACLFYGAPGTGKTETVLQLARATGREIVQVNVATLREMYVGESEKNTQKVFDDYKEKMQGADMTPILLFNEADGVFGKRHTGITNSVSQMENTIQNIILQNMETFEGILIATTNLTDNFDKAFERRFLFKVFFAKPKAEARKQIWMSMVPDLHSDDAATLAARYNFTGSMIENVAKRLTIDEILYERPVTLGTISRLCDEEQIKKPAGIKHLKI